MNLAPGGVYHARNVTTPAVRSYRTVSPLPLRSIERSEGEDPLGVPHAPWTMDPRRAVCSLWHFPWGCPHWPLTSTNALRSPDFPLAPCRDMKPADAWSTPTRPKFQRTTGRQLCTGFGPWQELPVHRLFQITFCVVTLSAGGTAHSEENDSLFKHGSYCVT